MDSTMDIVGLLATAETHLSEAKKILDGIKENKTLNTVAEKAEFLLDEYTKLDLSLRVKKMKLLESLVTMGLLGRNDTKAIYINGTYFTFLSGEMVNSSTKGWGVREEDSKITVQDFFSLLEKWGDLNYFFTRMIEMLNKNLNQNLALRTKDFKRINEIVDQLLKLMFLKLTEVKE